MPKITDRCRATFAMLLVTVFGGTISPAMGHQQKVELMASGCGTCIFSAEVAESSAPEQSHPSLCISNVQPQVYRIGGRKRMGVLLDGFVETDERVGNIALVLLYPPSEILGFDARLLCVRKWNEAGEMVSPVRSVRLPSGAEGSKGLKEIFQALFGVQYAGYATISVETPLPAMIEFPDKTIVSFPARPTPSFGYKIVLEYMLAKANVVFRNNVRKPYAACRSTKRNGIIYISC